MIINFKSIITQNDKPTEIAFNAPVTVATEMGFQVYEFEDPHQKIMNRIEVSPGAINIFAGPATLNLLLNQDLRVEYTTPNGAIYLTSHLHEVVVTPTTTRFRYNLKNGALVLGEYAITLTLLQE